MPVPIHNPLSGHHAPGYRFRFSVRAITRRSIFLPLALKQNDIIKRLKAGEDPHHVFNVSSIEEARNAFRELRRRHDFSYWAATKYKIRDVNDPDNIIPFVLNEHQHHIIDTFRKRYFRQESGRYIISKQTPRIGVTTCVQAYILWLQTYSYCLGNSQTCSASDFANRRLRENIYRYLGMSICPKKMKIPMGDFYCGSYFNTVRTPDALRGIDFSYVHLANMSEWSDKDMKKSTRAYCTAISGVLLDYFTLIVIEGDTSSSNPFFKYLLSRNPTPPPSDSHTPPNSPTSPFLHLPLI